MHQAQLFPAYGVDTQIVFYDFSFNYYKYPSRWKTKYNRERIGDLSIHRFEHFSIPKKYVYLRPKSFQKKILRNFENVLSEFSPDAIHAHTFFGIIAADIIFQKHRIPWIATEHSSGFTMPKGYSPGEINLYKNAISSCTGYFAISNFLKEHLSRKLNMDDIGVIPNFIDQAHFNYSNKDEANEHFRFVFVGELKRNKGIFDLVRAFSQYVNQFPRDELVVIGRGNEEKKLIELLKKYGLKDNVKLLGSLNHVSIPEVLRQCHCFVLPSHKETFSIATIEALACGLPAIVSECGGPEDYFEESMGLTFRVQDIEGLASQLVQMRREYQSFDRKKISDSILAQYSAEKVIPKLTELYHQIAP